MKSLAFSTLAMTLIATSAQAAEQRVRGAELETMVRDGVVLCERFESETGSCSALYRWDATEGRRETRLETLGGEPAVDVALQYPVRVEDDQLCFTLRADDLGFLFMAGGRELSEAEAEPMRAAVRAVYATAEGRLWCTAYWRDSVTGTLRAEVRVDGRPRLDLDATFQPVTTSPLPRLRLSRQAWSPAVLRAAALLPPPPASTPR